MTGEMTSTASTLTDKSLTDSTCQTILPLTLSSALKKMLAVDATLFAEACALFLMVNSSSLIEAASAQYAGSA